MPLVLLLLLAACGSDCNRDGCDALQTSASNNGIAIAGVIALASDVVANGCAECTFGSARIELWRTDSAPSNTEQARDITLSSEPTLVLSSNQKFNRVLDPGSYLFCVRPGCVPVQLVDSTVTVNIKLRKGPTGFFVHNESGGGLVETFGFDVGF